MLGAKSVIFCLVPAVDLSAISSHHSPPIRAYRAGSNRILRYVGATVWQLIMRTKTSCIFPLKMVLKGEKLECSGWFLRAR